MTTASTPTTAWPACNVVMRSVASLIAYAQNSRTHSKEQVQQIARSIKAFGWTVAVLIDENGRIIAGHGRVMAAKLLGIPEVPCMIAEGWTDAQKKAYTIADNQLALNSGWDMPTLAKEVRALDQLQFDLTLTGFGVEALGDLLLVVGDAQQPDPEPPAPLNTVIQYNIVFDDMAQQETWFTLIRHLKTRYPDAETIGERLALHIGDYEERTPDA